MNSAALFRKIPIDLSKLQIYLIKHNNSNKNIKSKIKCNKKKVCYEVKYLSCATNFQKLFIKILINLSKGILTKVNISNKNINSKNKRNKGKIGCYKDKCQIKLLSSATAQK